jgi:hypothetical protein
MNEWQTKDLFEASWIYSQGVSLLRLDPDSRYFWFVFKDKTLCEQLSQNYWQQNATGNIKQFVNSLKTLKDLVFSKSES